MLPETAPFPADQIAALNQHHLADERRAADLAERVPRRLSGGDRTAACRRGTAGATGTADHPVRHRVRQRRGAGRCRAQGCRQARLRRAGARHGGCHPGADRRRAEPAGDRQHVGRGRSAATRDRFLRRADGRRCAAPRRLALCGAGAGRSRLREVLRDRPAVRRTLRRAGCDARGGADRVRSGLRGAGGNLDRRNAWHVAGRVGRAGGRRGHPCRFRASRCRCSRAGAARGRSRRRSPSVSASPAAGPRPTPGMSSCRWPGRASSTSRAIRLGSCRATIRRWWTRCWRRRAWRATRRCARSCWSGSTSPR